MSRINWDIAEDRLQTLLDRSECLLDRFEFLDDLSNADLQHRMLQVTDGAIAFCEKPIIDGAALTTRQPSDASRQAALHQKEKVLAEYTKVQQQIEKVLEHLQLREPEDAGP